MIELQGYHFYNADVTVGGGAHVRNTLIRQLEYGSVMLPTSVAVGNGEPELTEFTMKELGIGFPLITHEDQPQPMSIPNPEYAALSSLGSASPLSGERSPLGAARLPGGVAAAQIPADVPPTFEVKVYNFTVQFCWQEKRLNQRLHQRLQQQLEQEQQNEQNQLAGGN